MASWPTTLPSPAMYGYGIEPEVQTVRTDMEAGLPRVRRRTAARNDAITLSWLMTDAQFAAFRTWFDGDCSGGAAWFTIALPLGDDTSTDARFMEGWRAEKISSSHWRVYGRVEVR